jgi:hypothetical protein
MLDAEHFFDGYKAEDPAYAMACLEAAPWAAPIWVVSCATLKAAPCRTR